jgi:hypothetical protein
MLETILLCFAIVFALIAALFVTSLARPPFSVHFGWLAVAFFLIVVLIGTVGGGGHLAHY